MSDTEDAMPWLTTCETCGVRSWDGDSHYHCSCGSPHVTGMYGHHTTLCRLLTGGWDERTTTFHHCGPDGDCDLSAPAPRDAQ